MQLRFPYARPCLVSALSLHGLTTTPHSLQFAVPRHCQAMHQEPVPTESFYFGEQAYRLGVVTLDGRGRTPTAYSIQKTLVGLLRYAPKFGRDVYLAGLRDALARRRLDRRTLTRLARTLRVSRALAHHLEVLSHDQDH